MIFFQITPEWVDLLLICSMRLYTQSFDQILLDLARIQTTFSSYQTCQLRNKKTNSCTKISHRIPCSDMKMGTDRFRYNKPSLGIHVYIIYESGWRLCCKCEKR